MASSLIPINQATIAELQLLHGIGPKRAERIIKFREHVSSIENIHDLATASGLSLKQAEPLSRLIEWKGEPLTPVKVAAPILIFSGSFLLLVAGLSKIQFNLASPAQLLYNFSILAIMIGCISLASEKLILYISGKQYVRSLAVISTAAFLIGIVSMVSLVCITVLLNLSPDLSARMTATINFLIFVFVTIYMINAPGIHMNRNNLFNAANPNNINNMAILFDYGHLALAALVLLMLTRFNSELGIEEIFALWASVLLANSGFELVRGRSAYHSLLSDREKNSLKFLYDENEGDALGVRNLALMKLSGVLLIGLAILIFTLALFQLIQGTATRP